MQRTSTTRPCWALKRTWQQRWSRSTATTWTFCCRPPRILWEQRGVHVAASRRRPAATAETDCWLWGVTSLTGVRAEFWMQELFPAAPCVTSSRRSGRSSFTRCPRSCHSSSSPFDTARRPPLPSPPWLAWRGGRSCSTLTSSAASPQILPVHTD